MPNIDSVPLAALGDEMSTITMYLSKGGPAESDRPEQVEQAVARWDDLIGRIIAGRALCLGDVRAKLQVVEALTCGESHILPDTWRQLFDGALSTLREIAATGDGALKDRAASALNALEALDEENFRSWATEARQLPSARLQRLLSDSYAALR